MLLEETMTDGQAALAVRILHKAGYDLAPALWDQYSKIRLSELLDELTEQRKQEEADALNDGPLSEQLEYLESKGR